MTSSRLSAFQSQLDIHKVDGFLVSNFFNILYLSGIKTLTPEEREAFLFITRKNSYVFTDGRYVDKHFLNLVTTLKAQFKLIEIGKDLFSHLKDIIESEHLASVGFEEEDLKFLEFKALQNIGENVMPVEHAVSKLREVKTQEEISYITKACELTDECLREITPLIKSGLSEKELAWKIEVWIREKGTELAFDPIVAIDENAAIPHYDTKTGTARIKSSSVILLDFGVEYKSYISDITRMVFVGKQSNEVVNMYNALLSAQEKTVAYIGKGKMLRDVDAFCRKELQNAGLPNYSHSTGHGVGLEVHENPKVSLKSEEVVTPHQVFTVEPGVYILEKYGMRIEDTVVINKDHNAVSLTSFPKTFLQL